MSRTHYTRNRRTRRPLRPERGLTLAEILVAMTVFVIAAAVALILYNALTQSYKRGDNAADVQQNTRLAFEQMVTDARMAGFNYNPDGSTDRPDEQIEGAWDTAITFRGDFDLDDPTDSVAPEAALAGGTENVVSTGNDEIVTYALAKEDGTGGQDLTFVADVKGVPRDGTLETVTLSNIALIQDGPPYTLYRITVNPDSTSVTRTPVADNIYALQFRYFDSGGSMLSPATPGDPSDDIGGADTGLAKGTRETIRRVELSIVGMTADPDLRYSDPDDPYPATQKHRKFSLVQDVTPRNLGYVGRPDVDLIPPGQPVNLVACPGQCNGVLLTWDPPDPGDLVSQWVAVRGTSPSSLGGPVSSKTNQVFVDGLTDGAGYYFRVRAEDLSGNISPMSDLANPQPATVADTTTPEAPASLQISGNSGGSPAAEADLVRVTWSPVSTNVQAVACDPEPNKIRDLLGYRLYRSESAGSLAAYVEPSALPVGTTEFEDTNVVACRTYYYDLRAVDKCGNESAPLAGNYDGTATTTDVPVQPTGLRADPGGSTVVNLAWDRVTTNTAGKSILVDTYRVYRAELPLGLTPSAAAAAIDWEVQAQQFDVTVTDVLNPSYTDTAAYVSDPANGLYYRVSGLTDCSSPYDEGAPSDVQAAASCDFGGTLALEPSEGASISGSTSVGLSVSPVDPLETFTGFVVISDPQGGVVATQGSGAAPLPLPFTFTWSTISLPPGNYVITGSVTNSSGCAQSISHTVSVTTPLPCCIAPQSPVLGPVVGKLSQRNSDILFNLVNQCGQDVTVSRMIVSWTNVVGFEKIEHLCYDVPAGVAPEDCTPILDFVPPQLSPVDVTFTPALFFGATRDDLNPLIMGFQYDVALVDGSLGETITLDAFYQTAGSTGDSQCTFQIQTNPLDIVVQP